MGLPSDAELEELIQGGEGPRVEFKASLSSKNDSVDLHRYICAFANDLPNYRLPGFLFLGIRDDGQPSGEAITDDLLLKLKNFVLDGTIQPRPSVVVERRHLRGANVAVLMVEPSRLVPVKHDQRIWVRPGPAVNEASRNDERLLNERRRSADLPFDARPFYGASLGDLNLDRFENTYLPRAVSPSVLAENRRSTEHKLATAGFIEPTPEGTPTPSGLLVLCEVPARYLAGAYVDFIRHAGPDRADPIIDHARFDGPIGELIPMVERRFLTHVQSRQDLSGPVRREQPDYPEEAFRQLFRNAVMHRDYEVSHDPVRVRWFSDRIEISNPGGPYGSVDVKNFGEGATDYRNPKLAEAMNVLGLVEKFGVGIAIAQRALAANGNPPAKLQPEQSRVVVILEPAH